MKRLGSRLALGLAASAVFAATAPCGVHAQGLGPERQDLRNLVGDIWSAGTSPVRASHRDLLPATAAVSAIALTAYFDSATVAWMGHHDRALVMRVLAPAREHFRLPAYEIGSGQYLLPIAGLTYAAGRLSHSGPLRDLGLGCFAGHLASFTVRDLVMHLVSRPRPRVTAKPFELSVPGSHDWLKQSFYSGHISNAMACASFAAHRFHLGAVAAVPYTYAAAVGLGRVADGAHWPSDMVTGALIGFTLGEEIAGRQLNRNAKRATAPTAEAGRGSWSIPLVNIVF